MDALRRLLALLPRQSSTLKLAQRKRRLEHTLRRQGVSNSAAKRITGRVVFEA